MKVNVWTIELKDADAEHTGKVELRIEATPERLTISHTKADKSATAEVHVELYEGLLMARIFLDNADEPASRIELDRITL